jgi:hypothetical protein
VESKMAHETTDALTLFSGHARTPSGCKSGDIKRTIIKKKSVRPRARAAPPAMRPAGRVGACTHVTSVGHCECARLCPPLHHARRARASGQEFLLNE